ncbi:MAG: hypothetical protein LLG16_00080, partial [Euryarchaeota archaeon]|nr:hypothetical protein [Euryarchaeota archaeon]
METHKMMMNGGHIHTEARCMSGPVPEPSGRNIKRWVTTKRDAETIIASRRPVPNLTLTHRKIIPESGISICL